MKGCVYAEDGECTVYKHIKCEHQEVEYNDYEPSAPVPYADINVVRCTYKQEGKE